MATFGRLSSFSLHRPDEAKSFGDAQTVSAPRSPSQSIADTEDARSIASVEEEYQDEGHDLRVSVEELSSNDSPSPEQTLPKHWFSFRKLWLFTGPGFLMSIAYLVLFWQLAGCSPTGTATADVAVLSRTQGTLRATCRLAPRRAIHFLGYCFGAQPWYGVQIISTLHSSSRQCNR